MQDREAYIDFINAFMTVSPTISFAILYMYEHRIPLC